MLLFLGEHAEKGVDDGGVKQDPGAPAQLGFGLLNRAPLAVGPVGDHRVVGVRDGQDARAEGKRLVLDAGRIA